MLQNATNNELIALQDQGELCAIAANALHGIMLELQHLVPSLVALLEALPQAEQPRVSFNLHEARVSFISGRDDIVIPMGAGPIAAPPAAGDDPAAPAPLAPG